MQNPDLNPAPAHAYAPDADRVGEAAPGRLREWVVHALALLILFLREHAGARRRARMPAWWVHRPEMVAGSTQELAASVRGAWGHEIAHMCRYSGIGPGHPEWTYLSRTILAFGGSLRGVDGRRHPQPWWRSPGIIPGMIGAEAEATRAIALLPVMGVTVARSAPPEQQALPAVSALPVPQALPAAGHAWSPTPRRRVFTRVSTGPPTGPPPDRASNPVMPERTGPERGQPRRTDSCIRAAVAPR